MTSFSPSLCDKICCSRVRFEKRTYRSLEPRDRQDTGSVGRSDFPTGDAQTLLKSLNHVVMNLPDEVIVYPGHGPSTTIGEERETNPFVER